MRVIVVSKAEDVPDKTIDSKPTLVYWNILGLVQPTRLALVYAGVDFVDVRIDAGEPGSTNYKMAWVTAKPGLHKVLDFPNLPYYFDEKVSLTQSDTILKHIGRTYGVDLMGQPGQEHVVDLVLDELKDQVATFVRLSYQQGPDALFELYKTQVPPLLVKFENLCSGKDYLTGDRPSIADFKLYSFLYNLRVIQTDLGDDSTAGIMTKEIDSFMARMEELPNVKEYMGSPHYMKRPLNNPHAQFK
jgi:glutathione S-transferase